MRLGVWMVLALGSSLGTASARNQSPSATPGQMEGMNTGQGASRPKATADVPAAVLKITFGSKSADWTPAALAALPHKTVTVHNDHTKADETYTGVPLMDLLVKLGVPDKPHGKDLALYLVAVV